MGQADNMSLDHAVMIRNLIALTLSKSIISSVCENNPCFPSLSTLGLSAMYMYDTNFFHVLDLVRVALYESVFAFRRCAF